MRYARLWLAAVWLIFSTVAPVHAAAMSPSACDRMVMPHTPARAPSSSGDLMLSCCQAPDILPVGADVILPLRTITFVQRRPAAVRGLAGIIPSADPRPPKSREA